MKLNILKNMIILILGILIGLWFAGIFSSNPSITVAKPSSSSVQPPASYSAIERKFAGRIDSFDNINAGLKVRISQTESALLLTKRQNHELNKTVDNLIKIHYATKDTIVKLENCDSLTTVCQELLIVNNTKDSLCESLSFSLQTQVSLRDSVIKTKDVQYDTLQSVYHRSLVEKQDLIQQNAEQRKAIRKQKRGRGLLTAIVVVLGGLLSFNTIH